MSKIANLGGKKSKVGLEGSFFPNIIIDDISLKMGHPTWCYSSQVVSNLACATLILIIPAVFEKGKKEKIIKEPSQSKKTFESNNDKRKLFDSLHVEQSELYEK